MTDFDRALRDIEAAAIDYTPGTTNLGFVARMALRAAREEGWQRGYYEGGDDERRARLAADQHARVQAEEADPT